MIRFAFQKNLCGSKQKGKKSGATVIIQGRSDEFRDLEHAEEGTDPKDLWMSERRK